MPTKEEMLSGVIRVNNERIDSEVVAHSSKREVQADDRGGNNQSAGVDSPRRTSVKAVESRPQESLREFAERRTGEISSALEEATDTVARLEAELVGVYICIDVLVEERQLLEKLYGNKDRDTSAGHKPATTLAAVLSDQKGDGSSRSGGVGGKRNRRKRKGGNEKGPDA